VNKPHKIAATGTLLTLALSILLAANSLSNYHFLTRQITVIPGPSEQTSQSAYRPGQVRYSKIVWVEDSPAAAPTSCAKEFRALRHRLLLNTSLALTLIFAVAATFVRRPF
jgi:hypothetical protein